MKFSLSHTPSSLSLSQLGDFGALSVAFGSASPLFAPGARLDGLLVLASTAPRPVALSRKPLLLRAAAAASASAASAGNARPLVLPKAFDQCPAPAGKGPAGKGPAGAKGQGGAGQGGGALVAGVVKCVESFGVFVECLGGLSALIPNGQLADQILAVTAKRSRDPSFFPVADPPCLVH